jgi:steroid delta-isomerase-like uncharacterized protein
MSALETLARKSITDFNESNWDAVRANCTPDTAYSETGTGRRLEGIDALLGAIREWKAAFPDLTGQVLRAAESADTVVIEVHWKGTHSGPLDTPAGTLPATGRTVDTLGTMWITVTDGRISAETNHLDALSLLAQIGALPAPA